VTFTPWTVPTNLALVATTGVAGFALQNATPTILTWTAPNDGNAHSVQWAGEIRVSVAQTGGQLTLSFTDPSNQGASTTVDNGGHGVGFNPMSNYRAVMVAPGTTVTLAQSTAMTLGTATAFASLWAA